MAQSDTSESPTSIEERDQPEGQRLRDINVTSLTERLSNMSSFRRCTQSSRAVPYTDFTH